MAADGTLTWRELWAETARRLGDRQHAKWVCEVASGLDGPEFMAELDAAATKRTVAHLDAMIERRLGGEPLQYVLGRWGFRRLDLLVDRRVLIPRPETEWVCEIALRAARRLAADRRGSSLRIADLGTGSGAIGLSLAAELPIGMAEVWLTDASADALDVARANLAGLGRAGAAVRLAAGEWFDALPDGLQGGLDLVVSNPPYVADGDPAVERDVVAWEPASALFAGPDGLDDIRAIAAGAVQWLRPGGELVVEIGHEQGALVRQVIDAAGLVNVTIAPDLTGRERIASARRPSGVS